MCDHPLSPCRISSPTVEWGELTGNKSFVPLICRRMATGLSLWLPGAQFLSAAAMIQLPKFLCECLWFIYLDTPLASCSLCRNQPGSPFLGSLQKNILVCSKPFCELLLLPGHSASSLRTTLSFSGLSWICQALLWALPFKTKTRKNRQLPLSFSALLLMSLRKGGDCIYIGEKGKINPNYYPDLRPATQSKSVN